MICTTIEQGKRLLELGLNPETADMVYPAWTLNDTPTKDICEIRRQDFENENDVPAWSLSALLELMPKDRFIDIELSYGGFSVDPLEYIEKWFILFENEKDYESDIKTFSSEHPIDAVFEMVCWLLEKGFIKGGER